MNEQALKERLKVIAKEKNILFNVVWKQLMLERFLVRLSQSEHTDKLIFKGGYLLAYIMNIGRETTDLDFLLTQMEAEEPRIRDTIVDIVSSECDDGFEYTFDGIEVLSQPHMDYSGYRVSLRTTFGKMRDKVQVDIGVGDVVEAEARDFGLFEYKGKSFYEGEMSLQVYPVETIFAEKLETVLSKGAANSRMKDYHDLYLLVHSEGIVNEERLRGAIENTFQNRGTTVQPILFTEGDLEALQSLWRSHYQGLGKVGEDLGLPQNIEEVISEINGYLE